MSLRKPWPSSISLNVGGKPKTRLTLVHSLLFTAKNGNYDEYVRLAIDLDTGNYYVENWFTAGQWHYLKGLKRTHIRNLILNHRDYFFDIYFDTIGMKGHWHKDYYEVRYADLL
jgi:hypothetical protein